MTRPAAALPDVLVCGVGGTLGEAWMRGLLNGLEDGAGLDFRGCRAFVGTSAGSIVTATLAAGRRPRAGAQAASAWAQDAPPGAADAPPADDGGGGPLRRAGAAALRGAGRLGTAALTPVAPLALAGVAPGGAAVRAAALAATPRPRRELHRLARILDALAPRFDGRLRIAAVDRRSGRRVVFGAPGAPAATVREAVLASCAVPWLFAPVPIGEREYVDGGVWSPTNLDAAPVRRGDRVLCLVPTAASRPFRAPTAAASAAEALVLRARGATVETITPDAASADVMGANLMQARRSARALEAGYAQGRRLAAAG